ncbi:PDDEXK nuclease domain-containing protein [Pseudarthrobacter sp. AL07]|uniref:PDDEXK nuclease domain-containing protein n=1 Tax=unclassified Pseudarthrobacter TaxID=2647000 RepID=UPI00249CBF63|nr:MULTISPECIES: PDDEXK nuclease domain-containing protein [unclassified Pseudarthrobacter]MDI3195753.1 PDDEXK nuclease domain-containing protein [Pseudarthrobacter sp. AL20]MDI3209895.1 PDDEXK nuclease domain-containing protein [Pseudarthrobacter sp. AL07]
MPDSASFESTPAKVGMPDWYPELLESVSREVSAGRSRAIASVNREMLLSYWTIGRELASRESAQGWGSKVVTRLSADVRSAFPEATGFSPRNLRYMKSFAQAWPDFPMLQAPLATLPWYHQIALLEKLGDPKTRLWYAAAAVENGWSRNVLAHHIETKLHQRSGKAVNNFKATLPPSDSDLAEQSFKDPYVFDFLAMTDKRNERGLEDQLIQHVEKFLLELGQGFAFVGRQVRLTIGDDEFYADLLFYNFRLRCFVVVELKATAFIPGHVGQLNMYMSAVDDLLAHPEDKPTVGLLLCKTKNNVVAEYSLRGFSSPIGVAEWESEVVKSLPEEFATTLPSISELEAELSQNEGSE